MRKIFSLVALALMFVGCGDELYGPNPEPKDPVASKGVDVTVKDVMDSSFVAVITPKEEGVFYSYILRQDNEVANLDSSSVFACSASAPVECVVEIDGKAATAKAKGTFNTKSSTIAFSGLMPNTSYIVYAVAGSKSGNVSSVVSAKAVTSDKELPRIVSGSTSGNKATLTFSENVKYVEGKEVSGTIYYKCYLTGSPAVAKTKASVSVSGNVATLTFADVKKAGSYYTVNVPDGTFTDITGNECKGFSSTITSEIGADGKFGYTGLVGWLPNAELVYTLPKVEDVMLKDYSTTQFSVSVPDGVARVDLKDGYLTVVTHKEGVSTTVSEYPMAKVTNYYGGYYDCVVKMAGTAVAGDQVTIKIPAGAIMDWYGNVNSKAIEVGPINIIAEPLKLTFTPEVTSNRITMSVESNDLTGGKRWVCVSGPKGSLPSDDAALIKSFVDMVAGYSVEDNISFLDELDTYFAYYGNDEVSEYNLSKGTAVDFAAFYLDDEGNALSEVFRASASTSATFTAPAGGAAAYIINPDFGSMIGAPAVLPTVIEKVSDSKYVVDGPINTNYDYTISMDESGNCLLEASATGLTAGGNVVYVEEIYTWNGSWSQTSFYDSIMGAFILTDVYYAGNSYFAYGTQSEAIVFTGSAPASTQSVNKFVARDFNLSPIAREIKADKAARRNHLR